MKTGFPTFDKNISEIKHGELVAFVERPAMGVDLLLNQLSFRMGESYKICIFKFLTCKEYYPIPKFDEEYTVSVDNRILDFSEIMLVCTKKKLEKGLDIVIINDLHLLRTCSGYTMDKLLWLLKNMAQVLQIAIIIHTYFRPLRNKQKNTFPTMDDLREYEIIRYADKIISFYRPAIMCATKDLALYIKDSKYELRITPLKDSGVGNSFKLYMGLENHLIYDKLYDEDFTLFEHHFFYDCFKK